MGSEKQHISFMKNALTIIAGLMLILLPAVTLGAMKGPDPSVNASWKGGGSLAANNSGKGTGAAMNSATIMNNGAFGGTIDFKGTVTAVNTTDRTFAINGRWISPQRWIDMARMMGFEVTGIDAATLRSLWNDLGVGDRIQVKAEISATGIRVTNWHLDKAVTDAARTQLQARLQLLLQQVNTLMMQLRAQGVNVGTTTTSTAP
jgi:hypothetical protein